MDIWEEQFRFYCYLKGPDFFRELLDSIWYFYAMTEEFDPNDVGDNELHQLIHTFYRSREPESLKILKSIINYFATQAVERKKELKEELKEESKPNSVQIKYMIGICQYFIDLNNDLHHCICEELFKEIENGEEVLVYIDNHDYISSFKNEDAPYMSAFMNAEEKIGNPIDYLHCSLVTKNMISYDRSMFNAILESDNNIREAIQKSYRPYCVEFVIPVDQEGRASGRYNRDDNLGQIKGEIGWFGARFVSNRTSRNSLSNSFVVGELLTIASPVKYKSGKLVYKRKLTPDENKKIEDDYSKYLPLARTDFDDILKSCTSDIQKASVYNVGHGNFITLENANNETKIVYDIGPYRKTSKKNYKAAYNKIAVVSPNLIIISHWDEDHYMGAFCDNPHILDVPWIAVKIKKSGKINAKRIMCCLLCNKRIGLIDPDDMTISQPFASYKMSVGTIELYRGSGCSSPITPINCQGIAVRIRIPGASALMCGDIPYNCLPDSILYGKEYKYVVIPHHASNMHQDSYDALDTISSIEYSIICVNGNDNLQHKKPGKKTEKVINGTHCTYIKKKTTNPLCFTDDKKHSIGGYECVLIKSTPINKIPKIK